MTDQALREYIEQKIFPQYEKNDSGHNMEHISYVIKRSLEFAEQFPQINFDMVYTIAAFHDIAHHIDKDRHEVLSAELFYQNEKMKDFFNEEQRRLIKEAIEDHRASLEYEPRSDYGKIISSADRTTSMESIIKRTHAYTLKHYPDFDMEQMIQRCYDHILKKYGDGGYAKTYCRDHAYEQFKKEVETILKNRSWFAELYQKVNHLEDNMKKQRRDQL